MGKKDKYLEEFEKIQREIVSEKMWQAFREGSGNYRENLEQIGFSWFEDYGPEEEEERVAVPENDNQEMLVAWFEGNIEFSDKLLDILQDERGSDEPNYPLVRKYFKSGNRHLFKLIKLGLQQDPTNIDLLSDLGYFHEFKYILSELIDHFMTACKLENDLQKFSELAQEFFFSTIEYDYNALYALRDLFTETSDKRKIINFFINEHENQKDEQVTLS